MSQTAITAKITGRVQRVAFRAWTRARARKLGLQGWVSNDPTGSVTAFFQGDPTAVETMLTDLWSGPAAAWVRDVQWHKSTPAPDSTSFVIRR
ncbi:acylphosphatase [Shimia sp.]|uniref:acylphosphatase n=1 Tax=Shimia sp. TaxID=1954381 RepID=UPI00329850B3